jgi:hypothetical protein
MTSVCGNVWWEILIFSEISVLQNEPQLMMVLRLIYSVHFFLKEKVRTQFPSQYLNNKGKKDLSETVYGINIMAVVPVRDVQAALATFNTYLIFRPILH